jgi:hypothetical protein
MTVVGAVCKRFADVDEALIARSKLHTQCVYNAVAPKTIHLNGAAPQKV